MAGQVRLLPAHEQVERDLRADHPQAARGVPGRPEGGAVGQVVQCAAHLGLGPASGPDEVRQARGRVLQQGRDANYSIWLATGTGISISATGMPNQLGVA
ncbi:hypothetical protein AB0K51_24615 [Kitasatospora sp. NPDC049285]|uniref:hypothetical protein n=1 Tax=Kitasatospora sp. NPDC049285 TaxID=3157096 RepID=UPI00343B44BC